MVILQDFEAFEEACEADESDVFFKLAPKTEVSQASVDLSGVSIFTDNIVPGKPVAIVCMLPSHFSPGKIIVFYCHIHTIADS